MAIIIPHNVLFFQILPWLPTKSVLRFNCVSKDWHEFLSSNMFHKMHNHHLDHQQNREKFLVYRHTLSTIDCEEPDNLTPRSFRPPKVDRFRDITFLTSFHGMVCLRVVMLPKKLFSSHWKENSKLILWNPMMNDFKTLSKPEYRRKIHSESALGMFYSSREDDYKLLSVISHDNAHIYSLKSDSWRTIAFQDTSELKLDLLSQGTCLNENLYFLNDLIKYSVIRFDTKTETFTEMKSTPMLNDDKDLYRATLMVKEDCIHVCIMFEVKKISHVIMVIELWKINKEGNWKKLESYRVDPSKMQYMKPLHLTRNGNLLMFQGQGYLYTVDLKKYNLKKKKTCKGIRKGKEISPLRVNDMVISKIVRYSETFVSPNQYI